MKITKVEPITLESPYRYGAPEGGEESHGVTYLFLLRVETDDGIVGWSDVETAPHVARAVVEAPSSGSGMFEGVAELVTGEDPFAVERIWDRVYRGSIYYGRRGAAIQVLSGLDIACHDIIGKAIGRPVSDLLGGAQRERVRAYASTLFRPTEASIRQACETYLERGFTAIKFGWGVFGEDIARDVRLVRTARDAVGPDVEILVDAGWLVRRSAYDAVELLRRLEPYRIYWLEDFLAPDDYAGYERVKAANPSTRIAAGEQEATGWGFRDLIQRGKVDVVQPDLSRAGGFTHFRRIAWDAEAAGIDVCPHAWMTDLLTASSLHANAVLKRSLMLEYNVSQSPMLSEIIVDPIQMTSDGYIPVPTRPGLGVEINEKAVERFRVR